jgi:hypothetical protein
MTIFVDAADIIGFAVAILVLLVIFIATVLDKWESRKNARRRIRK